MILFIAFLLIGCNTQKIDVMHCAEAIKSGDNFIIYYSENPSQINKKYSAPDIDDGFYILMFDHEDLINVEQGLLNFENGIASILNGC